MKRTALLALALGLVASASAGAAEPTAVISATPLLDVAQDSVKGCLTIQEEKRTLFRKTLKPVSQYCFNGLVNDDKDRLPAAVVDAQTIRASVGTETAYIQSASYEKTEEVSFNQVPAAVASSGLKIEPAIYKAVRTVTPGVIYSGLDAAIRFNRTESGDVTGNLKLTIRKLQKMQEFALKANPDLVIELPTSNVVEFDGNFAKPFKGLKHGVYLISLDFTVTPAKKESTHKGAQVAKAP